ncbi:MAG TPA: nucleotide exchange factor GrpE [Opitutaceae bacterium]|nr:nucleotide exchange factor GrpE [Opitutaceae bacterium]
MPEASATPPAPESTPPPAAEQATTTPPVEGARPEPVEGVSPEQQRIAELEARVQQAEAALAEEREKFLRKVADFENTRRRITGDAQRTAESKKTEFIQQALSIADNLEMALLTPADKETVDHLTTGVRMTLEKFYQLLREHGIEKIPSLDQPFDPNRHEAVSMQKIEGKPDHTIVQVYREGYIKGDQVLRYAQVVVNQL